MKRALLLLALVTLVVWLAEAEPTAGTAGPAQGSAALNAAAPAVSAVPAAAARQESCCVNPWESDPHWECFSGACYQVSGCGSSVDCSTCGCDPNAEWACINDGGEWDSWNCTCSYSCDPGGWNEAYCWDIGGTWDPWSCTCSPPQCNPGSPVLTYSEYWSDYYCDGCYYVDCDNWCDHYTQYCQDGTVYDQWTECTNSCFQSWDYCDACAGGGGGGGGGCWEGGWDCWCDWDWGYCCDWDYCYEIDMSAQ